jgi:hypothetical protein
MRIMRCCGARAYSTCPGTRQTTSAPQVGHFTASANERHFTYTYETAVLPPGAREVEVWSTGRLMREQRSTRFDERVEFEVGLTERLQTALYLN